MIGNPFVAVYPDEQVPSLTGVKDVSTPREGRASDAANLRFPLPMVFVIVGTALSVATAQYVAASSQREAQAEIQSDIRDMKTRMEMQATVTAADKRADVMMYDNLNKSVDELRRQTQLLQLQYTELSKQIQSRR